MKYLATVIVSLVALSAQAQIVTRDQAQVTNVTPIVDQIRQPGQCRQYQGNAQTQQGPNVGRAAIGALVGGVIGSRFGAGHGRDAMIAAGAATGAVIGAGQNDQSQTVQCDQDTIVEQIRGYRVAYTYQGYQATVNLPYQPGPTINVTITVDVEVQQPQQGFQQRR
jgi:uncharacterized protein YcfJ